MAGVPLYKVIPGTNFTVDGFRYPQSWIKAYFLTHAHSDHYTGLNENWSAGPIYCSPVTAALAEHLAGVPAEYLHSLQLNTPYVIEGVQVVLVDANHCPGAVQLLFELPDGSKYIHCGDMRYCTQMQANQHLARFRGANAVFLDTTYCRPRHTFPAQEAAVEFVASCVQQLLQEDAQADSQAQGTDDHLATGNRAQDVEEGAAITHDGGGSELLDAKEEPVGSNRSQQLEDHLAGQQVQQQAECQVVGDDICDSQVTAGEALGFKRLYLISTYVIGKERLLLAVARRTGRRLLVTQRKLEVLRRVGLSDVELSAYFTTDPRETPIHVLRWGVLGDTWPYFRPNYSNMEQALTQTEAQEVVGFVPTGWLHEMSKAAAKGTFPCRTKGSCTVWLIPYSEHSSFAELKEYVAWLRPKQVIPTVNVGEVGAAGDKHRNSMLQHFRGLLDETSNKAAFLARMTSAAAAAAATMAVMTATAGGTEPANGNNDAGANQADATAGDAGDNAPGAELLYANVAAADSSEGFGECEDPSRPTTIAITAAHGVGTAAAASTQPDTLANMENAGQQLMTAATDPGQGATAAADVELLLAIAGPDSLLSSTDAQQLLMAAKGDVNAAINAFLDDSYNGNKQSAAAQLPPAAGGGSSNSRKLQLKQSVSTNNRKGSKKQSKQAAATGQAAITAFFGQATRDNSQKQQHSVRTTEAVPLDAHRVLKHQQLQQATPHLSAAVPQHSPGTAAAAAASAAGPVVGFQIVLPSLGCKSSPPTPAAAAARPPHLVAVSQQSLATPTAHVAVMNASSAVAQQAREAPSHRDLASPPAAQADHSSPPPSPSPAVADAVVDAFQQQPKQPATAEGPSRDSGPGRLGSAAEACAGPITEQQQQQSAKQSWAAVFPGALTPTAKRRKVSAAVTTAAQLSPKPIQSITAVAVHKVALPDQAALPDRAALPLPAPDAHNTAKSMLSGSISSGSSISRSVRDAPLLPLTRYNPLTDACWPPGTAAPYLALGLTLAAVDGTTSRLKIADGLTNLFRSLMLMSPGDVTAAAYLFCGKIAPEYTSGCELNVGGGVVSSALCEVCGVTRNQLREMYAQHGDLGDVAQACRRRQTSLLPPPPLTITGLFNTLHSLAAQAGQGAAGRRQSTVARLLRCCRDVETKYLVRTLVQNLRVGAGWKSVLGPLAKAALLHRNMMQAAGLLPPTTEQQQQQQQQVQASALDPAAMAAAAQHAGSAAAKVTKTQLEAAAAAAAAAYHTCPNLGIIVDVLMTVGPEGLATKVQLTCGVPVKPMLARPCTSTADALQQLAATAAVAATGGKRPCRNAGGDISSSKQGRQTTAAAIPAAADAVGLEAEDVSDVEADEADDVIMIDHVMSSAITAPAVVAGEGAVSARAGATAAAVNSVLSILAEYKYDGQRAQIHVGQDRQVHVFSRNCEDRTHSFPDVAAAMLAAVASAALPLVVDAELAAVDRSDGNRIRAFQELASRPRGSAAGAAGPGSNAVRSSAAAATTAESSDAGGQRPTQQQQQQRQKQHKLDLTSAPSSVDMVQSHQQHQDRHQVQRPHESGIDVCVFVFDTLCVGGVDMMGRSLRERRAALVEALPGAAAGVVQLAEGVELQLGSTAEAAAESLLTVTADDVTASTETAQQLSSAAAGAVEDAEQSVTDFFFKALAAGTEGLMLKLLDGPGSVYQPAKRGLSWIKLKRDYLEGLADSIDLVPIGAWQGQGRKVKWYSPFLLAVYDPATETYQSLCRCMSGFTDEFYAAATARLGTSAVPGPKPYYETFERPDVWFEPTEVWEIRGADVSISPVHRAAAGRLHTDRGLGLRFPRFLRIREDKHPDEASGPEFIVDLYNKQTRRVVNK